MKLALTDRGEPVKVLQRGLNNLGSLLIVDGEFGPMTGEAVVDARTQLGLPPGADADDALQQALSAHPDPCPELTAAGVTMIAREEVSGAREYRRSYAHPTWPKLESGITIGIGYDLRFADEARLQADWGGVLKPDFVRELREVLGVIGSAALRAQVREVDIPLLDAMAVFVNRSVPEYQTRTRSIYPTLDSLAPERRTALVSLVYNRGTGLAGVRRREMREIQRLLAAGRQNEVAQQFESMTRLWIHDPDAKGLVERRRREASLWESGFAALELA